MVDSESVWDGHAGELIRFATALVGPSDAEDLLSSVFIAAMTSPKWDSVVNHRAYLFRALSNSAQNWHRSRRSRARRERIAAPREIEPADDTAEVRALLSCLTVRQRSVIWLSYWADATDAEVADTLGVSVRTVERELRVARLRLERELR